ncbi:MAG TPA: HPr family phosphocarrier protein [Anaerovoracaceae bacterium]|nr:HPr family phosphocarrier protein [Anaerovoracaceae bacterium]
MLELNLILNNKSGLHARPASLFTKEASKYSSTITVVKDGKEYNAKSILHILGMGAVKGTKLTIIAEGADEKAAIDSLKVLADQDFGE